MTDTYELEGSEDFKEALEVIASHLEKHAPVAGTPEKPQDFVLVLPVDDENHRLFLLSDFGVRGNLSSDVEGMEKH